MGDSLEPVDGRIRPTRCKKTVYSLSHDVQILHKRILQNVNGLGGHPLGLLDLLEAHSANTGGHSVSQSALLRHALHAFLVLILKDESLHVSAY